MYIKLLIFCQILLIGLKLTGVINGSWWGVLFPILSYVIVSIIFIMYQYKSELKEWIEELKELIEEEIKYPEDD